MSAARCQATPVNRFGPGALPLAGAPRAFLALLAGPQVHSGGQLELRKPESAPNQNARDCSLGRARLDLRR